MRIVTWNMQGGSHATEAGKAAALRAWMADGVDVICCQESTARLETFSILQDTRGGVNKYVMPAPAGGYDLRHDPASDYACYHYTWMAHDGGNARCSLTVYARLAALTFGTAVIGPRRPMLWLCLQDGVRYVCCVHLTSGNVRAARAELEQAFTWLAPLPGSYVVGDMNIPAADAALWLGGTQALAAWRVHAPGHPTQAGGSVLDYCITRAPVLAAQRIDAVLSDHWPVVVTLPD